MEERQEYEVEHKKCCAYIKNCWWLDVGLSYAIVKICHISRIQVKRHTSVFNNCHLVQAQSIYGTYQHTEPQDSLTLNNLFDGDDDDGFCLLL